jgi:hypothetical protein
MTKLLFEIEQQNRLSQEGLLQRFTQSCYGTQETLGDIRIHKTDKFKELGSKTKTREYEEWFLKYNPNMKKTRKNNESRNNITKRRKTPKSVSFIDSMKTSGILI